MRCPYCGNENPGDHRFCGMCGRPLVEARPNSPVPKEPAPRHEPEPSPAPAYTGGLFNLGAPSDKPYRSLDYLLEDDEEPKSNKGLIFLCLIALALVGGLGWLRWHNGSLPSFKSLIHESKPAPATPPNAGEGSANTPAPDSQDPAGSNASNQPGSQGVAAATPPAANSDAGSNSPSSSTSNPPAASANSANAPNPATPSTNPATPSGDSDPNAAAAEHASPPPSASSDKASEPPAPAPPPAAAPAKPKTAAKPAPKPAPKVPDQVTLGEQYLYGRGVPQNCERGLRYVKPAADQSNPKAMITMGALYATGHCLSRDLPTAYRFFALALRSDPENGPLRQNAEMVWKQMTSEERKQAIRLTQ